MRNDEKTESKIGVRNAECGMSEEQKGDKDVLLFLATFHCPPATVRFGMRNVERRKSISLSILQSLAAFDTPHSAFEFSYHRPPAAVRFSSGRGGTPGRDRLQWKSPFRSGAFEHGQSIIPLNPPLEKGEKFTLPFCKGRSGGIMVPTRNTDTDAAFSM
jgi:hypothetical protein